MPGSGSTSKPALFARLVKIEHSVYALPFAYAGAFLAANLSCEMSSSKKVKELVDDARKAHVAILPPAIQRSVWEFEPEADGRGEGARHRGLEG